MKFSTNLLLPGILLILLNWLTAQDIPVIEDTYVLRPDDVVNLSVFNEPDLSKEVAVLKNGIASFQLIGAVKIGGLTVVDAVTKIRSLYAEDYLKNPEMTLTISQYATDYVSVIGQVSQPGTVAIPHGGKLDVGSALASVGGITDSANPGNIHLIPAKGAGRVLSYKDIQGDLGRIALSAGDRIIVHESAFARSAFVVLGEVTGPGTFPLPKSGQLNLATALATAGGVTEFVDPTPKGVSLTKAGGGTSTYSIEAINGGGAGKVTVGPGDTIMVARNRFANSTVMMLGQVNRKGAIPFPLDGRLDIMTAIALAGGFSDIANPKKVKITRKGRDYTVNTRNLSERKEGTVWLYQDDIVTVAESFF